MIFYAFHIMLVRPSERAIFHSARAYDLVYGATLGTLIILALSLGMLRQPLHELRDYYGEKIAFYFSWIEHYTRYLIYLTVFAIIAVAFGASEVAVVVSPLSHTPRTSPSQLSLTHLRAAGRVPGAMPEHHVVAALRHTRSLRWEAPRSR